jgi:hypothetical protein
VQIGEVGEERLLAEPAGDRGGEEPFDRAFALFGLAAGREFAVGDGAAEAALGVVVGWLDVVGVAEGREGGRAFEQVVGEEAVVRRFGALAGRVLEQRAERVLEWRGLGLEPVTVGVLLVAVARLEEGCGDRESCLAELLLCSEPPRCGR